MTQTVTIQGPLTEEDIARIIAVVGDIEEDRPDETFSIFFNQPNIGGDEFRDMIERVNPLRPGYTRQITVVEQNDVRS
jgi:hypothetical protein